MRGIIIEKAPVLKTLQPVGKLIGFTRGLLPVLVPVEL